MSWKRLKRKETKEGGGWVWEVFLEKIMNEKGGKDFTEVGMSLWTALVRVEKGNFISSG